MKGNKKTYSTISELVSDALMDVQEGDNKREKFTRFALKYFDEVNFKHGADIKTVSLDMKPWKAIQLPDDCVDWITIGIQCGEDIKTFIHEPYAVAMLHEKDSETGVKIPNEPCPDYFNVNDWPVESSAIIPFFNVNPNGESPGKMFGLAVHDNGLAYFSENRNKDVCEIQFRGDIDSTQKIYLQYLSSGMEPCGETIVHPYFKEYIIAGIHVSRCRFGSREEKAMLEDAKEEFQRQYYMVLDNTWSWSAEDVIELLKSGYGLYPKK